MTHTRLLFALITLSLTLGACHPTTKTEVTRVCRISYFGDTKNPEDSKVFYELCWEDDTLRSLTHRATDDSLLYYPEKGIVGRNPFHYRQHYTYQDGKLSRRDNDFFYLTYTYDGDRLQRIDQYTHGGIHFLYLKYNYHDNEVVDMTLYEMSKECIVSIEAELYDYHDTLGNPIRHALTTDTSLHPSYRTSLRYVDGNVVEARCISIDGSWTCSTTLQYDSIANPFFGLHIVGCSLDLYSASLPFAMCNMGLSKNNPIQCQVMLSTPNDTGTNSILKYEYEYDEGRPVIDYRNSYKYEYLK